VKHEGLADKRLQNLLQNKLALLKKGLANPQTGPRALRALIRDMHASEIAYLIQYLDEPMRQAFVTWLKPKFDPEVFLFLAHNLREDLIALLSAREIVKILTVLESDDALALFSCLEECARIQVLDAMAPGQRMAFLNRLVYPESSAGRLMQQEVLALPEHWTVKQSLEYIAEAPDVPDNCYDAIIIDNDRCPVGSIGLSQLIKKARTVQLHTIMDRQVRPIPANLDQEEVALTFRLYDLMWAPVVDDKGHLIGMITADDVIDVVDRKATEDLLHMGRVHGSDFYESVLRTSISRIHWLFVTFCNSLLTSLVINEFQETLRDKVALAILMPMAAAMGGSSGIQSITIATRALATKELGRVNMMRAFFKEVRVGLINGLVFGVLLSGIVFAWFQDGQFALILGSAVIFNMIWAGGAGILIPIMISRLGFDPALSAGPLLTTSTDVIGYALFLGLAKMGMR
jgi:magnesium transporter